MNQRQAKAIRKAVKRQCVEHGVTSETSYVHDEVEVAPTTKNLQHPLTIKGGMGLRRLIRRVSPDCERGVYLLTKRALKQGAVANEV